MAATEFQDESVNKDKIHSETTHLNGDNPSETTQINGDKPSETTQINGEKALENGHPIDDKAPENDNSTDDNVTNPVGTLQEKMQHLGTPVYSLLESSGASHAPTFSIQVSLGDLTATASGSTKKTAKHGAAQAMLSLLKQSKPSTDSPSKSASNQTNTSPNPTRNPAPNQTDSKPLATSGNSVGELQELCVRLKLPLPRYELEQSSGPSHQPQFGMACVVQDRRETGVAGNKKDAKREVARLMVLAINGSEAEKEKVINVDDSNKDDEVNIAEEK